MYIVAEPARRDRLDRLLALSIISGTRRKWRRREWGRNHDEPATATHPAHSPAPIHLPTDKYENPRLR